MLAEALAGIEAALDAGFEKVKINAVLIGGFNDDEVEEIIAFARAHAVRAVNLLPYHSTGSHKYGKLGRDYLASELTAPSDEEMQALVKQWNEAGFANVKIGG